jgi:uncharacterized RDD family membrane protein YckC
MTSTAHNGTPAGRYAGPATRLAAYAVDTVVSTVVFAVLVVGFVAVVDIVSGAKIRLQVPAEIGAPAAGAWLFSYYFASWATAEKTPGMALLGLRVARRDGSEIRVGQAALRTLVLPVSFIGGLGFVGIVIGREHRALHDVLAGTTVLYDWEARPPIRA